MKKHKIISILLIVLSILPVYYAVELMRLHSDARWALLMLLCVPIHILSAVYGRYLKKKQHRYKGVYITALVCLPVLLLLCSVQFVRNEYDYYYAKNLMQGIEEQTGFALPDHFEADITVSENYTECYIRILDASEKQAMDAAIQDSGLWTNSFDTRIINALPIYIVPGLVNYHCCMIYNETTGELNQYPETPGEYKCVFLAYDINLGRLWILRADGVFD